MAGHNEILHYLLDETQKGYVFGPGVAFGELTPERRVAIHWEADIVADLVRDPLKEVLGKMLPDVPAAKRDAELEGAIDKTIAFMPELTAGELDSGRGRVLLASSAMGGIGMYFGDERMDWGDEYMLLAVESECSPVPTIVPRDKRALVASRSTLFGFMRERIETVSHEDAPDIYHGFVDTVLGNEARHFRLSQNYAGLGNSAALHMERDEDQERYLDNNATQLATLMVEDAGFQAVTGILHAAYRSEKPRQKPGLPTIREIHGTPLMQRKIKIWNTVARIADERGDWQMDRGDSPEKGVFSINPFNQYHYGMVETFCQLAEIEDAGTIHSLHKNFRNFHRSETDREESGHFITETFFDQMRRSFQDIHPEYWNYFERYFILARRVGEISFVNMMGDIAMGG